ncbi:MAG: Uma2 family endonuclease [Cyanobacteria bacterium]|nr:Uma2 family endonuclease [Cyanobacteriota bacterium]MDW8200455.1 hypothetical protein [Cyanobacteriota bacterium SKYGB_h_bin112]
MTMPAVTTAYCTPDEYLELEVDADDRHDYQDRAIVSMASSTPNHNQAG